ncbi:MAG: hypothetical protein ABWW69_03875 [Pyrodictiaceae archaeon]
MSKLNALDKCLDAMRDSDARVSLDIIIKTVEYFKTELLGRFTPG